MTVDKITTIGQVRTLIVNNSRLITVDSYETGQRTLKSLIQCTPVGQPVHFNLETSKDVRKESQVQREDNIKVKSKYGLNRYQVVQDKLYGRAFVHAAVHIGVHKRRKIVYTS
jgi:hypothetical protein